MLAKSSEKALVKRFCEKNFTEFLARVEKTVSVFYLPPCAGSVQKQYFVNNQELTKKNLGLYIFTSYERSECFIFEVKRKMLHSEVASSEKASFL